MPTAYVLGAGASRDAGYPFAKDMGKGLLRWMERAEPDGFCNFASHASFLRSKFENPEDIEVLLEQLDDVTALHDSPVLEDRVRAAQANEHRQVLIHALRRWFEQIARTPSNSYRLFASQVLVPGDSVITFNYDVSLDQELKRAGIWEIGDGYGFQVENLPARSKVALLKLHGSINWRALLFGGLTASGVYAYERSLGSRPVFFDDDLRSLGYAHEVDSRIPRHGGAAIESMILPVHEKRFFYRTSFGDEWVSFWNSLWNFAAEALRTSNRIVICGYSVLPIDERACSLLLADPKIQAQFEVCCGDDSSGIAERLRSFGRNAYPAVHTIFGDWVAARANLGQQPARTEAR